MKDFRGNLAWIHKWEGHVGRPYWPRGNSGITLDPGVDLGHADQALVERCYGSLVTSEQLGDLIDVMGIRGVDAGTALDDAMKEGSPMASVRITRDQAVQLMNITVEPYWRRISKRFPILGDTATPAAVQTALLSLAYNRGPGNRGLNELTQPLIDRDWPRVGELISAMQQDHTLEGVRRRRRAEGALILDSLHPEKSPLAGFHGDLAWVHQKEGHVGKPYWPRGRSGITLDPGVDVGYAEPAHIEKSYSGIIDVHQMEDLRKVFGIKGENAGNTLKQAQEKKMLFTTIRISRDQAGNLFGVVAAPYWRRIAKRFPVLPAKTTPASVQTALLSLAYNRGPGNKDLEQLRGPLQTGNWGQVGERIAAMQQDHQLAGIRRRRQAEGQLILDSLG